MKITQLRGDLAAFRNLELSIVLNAMKTENSRKPVTTLRQNIPYLTPGIKSRKDTCSFVWRYAEAG